MRELGLASKAKMPSTMSSGLVIFPIALLLGMGWSLFVLSVRPDTWPWWGDFLLTAPVWALAISIGKRIEQWYLWAVTGVATTKILSILLQSHPDLMNEFVSAMRTDETFAAYLDKTSKPQ